MAHLQRTGKYGEMNHKGIAKRSKQKEWIMKFNAKGDRHFTKDGTFAEITVDSVLGARARMAEE